MSIIKGRQTHDNIRRAIHLIEKANKKKLPAVLVGLDAEKAFDRVDWSFLFRVLAAFGFDDKFISMIRANYSQPKSRVQVNGAVSAPFSLTRGTRQGCPLSPLLLAMSIEPLAMSIRDNEDIQGVPFEGEEHKISLFADDVLLSLKDPAQSLSSLQFELAKFEAVGGFKVNFDKSYVLNLTLKEEEAHTFQAQSSLQWSSHSFQYLGIQLTPRVKGLYKANYPTALLQVQNDLKQWSPLFISWLGRIHAVKMTLLPKLLYLFQALPIALDSTFLPKIKSLLTKFIWQKGGARLSFAILRRPKKKGEVGLPDVGLYYKAAQLIIVTEWFQRGSKKHWLNMDRGVAGGSIWDMIWKPKAGRPANVYISTPTCTVLQVWDSLTREDTWTTFPFPYTPIHFNPAFPPALKEGPFDAWREGGCIMLEHLFHNHNILSFENCRREYHLPSNEYFHYLQRRHWALNPYIREAATREKTGFEKYVRTVGSMKGVISFLYNYLLSNLHTAQPRYMAMWEGLIQRAIPEKEWTALWSNILKFNHSLELRDAHLKTLMDWYLHPAKIHRLFPNTTDRCWRGCGFFGRF